MKYNSYIIGSAEPFWMETVYDCLTKKIEETEGKNHGRVKKEVEYKEVFFPKFSYISNKA